MPYTGLWGFLTLLLIIAVAYVLITDTFNVSTSVEKPLGLLASKGTTTLFCTGGEGAACCNKVEHQYTPGMAITIDHDKGIVYVFNDNRSAVGKILEDQEGHLLFGRKATEICDDTAPEGCKIADGEINRLTGVGNITVIDRAGNTRMEWHQIVCQRRSRRF
jgi:hypothetical protein